MNRRARNFLPLLAITKRLFAGCSNSLEQPLHTGPVLKLPKKWTLMSISIPPDISVAVSGRTRTLSVVFILLAIDRICACAPRRDHQGLTGAGGA